MHHDSHRLTPLTTLQSTSKRLLRTLFPILPATTVTTVVMYLTMSNLTAGGAIAGLLTSIAYTSTCLRAQSITGALFVRGTSARRPRLRKFVLPLLRAV